MKSTNMVQLTDKLIIPYAIAVNKDKFYMFGQVELKSTSRCYLSVSKARWRTSSIVKSKPEDLEWS